MTLVNGLKTDEERVQLGVLNFIQVPLAMDLSLTKDFVTFLSLMDMQQVEAHPIVSTRTISVSSYVVDKENRDPNKLKESLEKDKVTENVIKSPLTAVLFNQVHRHFRLICACKKGGSTSKRKTAVFKTLAIYLNASSMARDLARNGLLEEILQRFKATLDGQGMASCQEFVRKFGDTKKAPIVEEFDLLLDILMGWFSAETLLDVEQVERLSQSLLKLWSWMVSNQKLQVKCVRLLALLSEDSVPICKAFCSQYSSISPSVLQLLVQMIGQEMGKVKHPKFNLLLLRCSIRVLMNCCCCVEGRLLIGKLAVMEHMDRIHPQVTKWHEPWPQITELWLEFWEVYSRYPEGAKLTHQNMLFSVVQRGKVARITEKALTIFRNMAFVADNRNALLNSEAYINMLKYILDAEAPNEQIKLVIVAIWKLASNSFKAKNKIKSTSIPGKLALLEKRVVLMPDDDVQRADILMALDMIKGVLNT